MGLLPAAVELQIPSARRTARVPPGHRHNRVLVIVHDQNQLASVSTFDLPNTAQVHDVPAVYSQESGVGQFVVQLVEAGRDGL
jgi:hypothetical protein